MTCGCKGRFVRNVSNRRKTTLAKYWSRKNVPVCEKEKFAMEKKEEDPGLHRKRDGLGTRMPRLQKEFNWATNEESGKKLGQNCKTRGERK